MQVMQVDSAAIAVAIVMVLHSATAPAAEPVRAVDIVEASAFLEEYRITGEAQSAQFYDLYSDRAVIHARVQGNDQGVAFQGRAFKAWGRELLKDGRTGLDGSVFREATVEQRANRLIIRAKRYSTTRCYWDPVYQVGIEREGGAYRIVDERLTTNPTARCTSAPNAVGGSQPNPSVVVEPTPAMSSARAPETAPTDSPEWRPLSEQELADKSMRLAQQLAAARASLPPSENARSPSVVTIAAQSRASLSAAAAAGQGDGANSLRITPQDSE